MSAGQDRVVSAGVPARRPTQPDGILFLDELTAADQRLQISAYSLILDRRVGNYHLPDGWQVIAAGNASFHGAVSHDMGTALADRMFHFNVQTVIDAFLALRARKDFAPEVMAYLKVRPDKLDDTQAQLADDHLIGASPARLGGHFQRAEVATMSEHAKRIFVQGRIGAANAAEFFGVLREIQAGARRDPAARGAPGRGNRRAAAEDARRAVRHDLRTAGGRRATTARLARALEIIEQLPDIRRATRCRCARRRRWRWSCSCRGRCPRAGSGDPRQPGRIALRRAAPSAKQPMPEARLPHEHRGTRAIQRMVEFAPSTGGLALWVQHQRSARRQSMRRRLRPMATRSFMAPAFETLPGRANRPDWWPTRCCISRCGIAQRFLELKQLLGDVDLKLFNICADAIVNSTLAHLELARTAARRRVARPAAFRLRSASKSRSRRSLLEWDVERLYRAIDDRQQSRAKGPQGGPPRRMAVPSKERQRERQKRADLRVAGERDPKRRLQVGPRARAMGAEQSIMDIAPAPDPARRPRRRLDEALRWSERIGGPRERRRALHAARTDRRLPEVKTPWEQVLRTQLARSLCAEARTLPGRGPRAPTSRTRDGPDRPALPWSPASAGEPTPRLVVIVDVSGSIEDDCWSGSRSEIEAITRRQEAGLILVIGDDRVRGVERSSRASADLRKIEFQGRGGTDFTPLLMEADKHRPDIAVVLTDLDGPASFRPALAGDLGGSRGQPRRRRALRAKNCARLSPAHLIRLTNSRRHREAASAAAAIHCIIALSVDCFARLAMTSTPN